MNYKEGNLIRIDLVDTSNVVVTLEEYVRGKWEYITVKFEQEQEANKYLDDIKRDFKRRIISVEKRIMVYEKYVQK